MTPIGINNGNFRNGDYLEWAAQDLSSVPTWDQLMEEKKIKEAYGEGWEQDAENIHALIVAVESGNTILHPVEAAYELEKAMDEGFEDDWCDNGLFDDRPYRPATSDGDLPF